MSRIGRIPIEVPGGVKVEMKGEKVHVEGPLGKMDLDVHPQVKINISKGRIEVKRQGDTALEKSLHGLFRRLIDNIITGVTKGFEKNLEIQGVGYRAKVEGKTLVLQLGFSHPVKYPIAEGIKIAVADNTKISVKGYDKQLVGQVAAEIRRFYPPEPYKGKGIRYAGEHVRRKAGKAVAGKSA